MKFKELSSEAQGKAVDEFFASCGEEVYKVEVSGVIAVIKAFAKTIGAECRIFGDNVVGMGVSLYANDLYYEEYKFDCESVSPECADAPELAWRLEEMWNPRVGTWSERRKDAQERMDNYDLYTDEFERASDDEDKNDCEANEFVENDIEHLVSTWLDGTAMFYSSWAFAVEFMDDHEYNEDGTIAA